MNSLYVLLIFFIISVLSYIAAVVYINLYKKYKNSEYKVYVINLKRRIDRLLNFEKHYHLGLPFEVVDAVDGKLLDKDQLKRDGVIGNIGYQSIRNTENGILKKYHYELGTLGAVGCSLSHIKIWNRAANENDKYAIVFEDDAWVIGITIKDLEERIKTLPSDWQIYMIGQPHTIKEGVKVQKNLYRLTRFCGTHAYVLNKGAARWLLDNGHLFPINQQIDSHLAELSQDYGLNIYIHTNMAIVMPFGGNSDIQVFSDKASFKRLKLES